MNSRYPEIPAERSDDLHHLDMADRADLVLFMAGNQFMAMPRLIAAFQQHYPEVKNIFYETLPPGLELRQILAGGALFQGKLLTIPADVYAAVNEAAMQTLEENRLIAPGDYFPYLRNRLTLMVPAGNPADIRSVADLGRDDVRISQPDPKHEDIAHHITNMYRQAGGEALVRQIMETKRAAGTTVLTTVHHRETPARIREKSVDVGPVWATESLHARQSGLAFELIEPGALLDQREMVRYYICRLSNGRNRDNAEKFLDFIKSPAAQGIFAAFGFEPGFG
ncbi:MAG: substrate-binding domain-containing protein [Deltaproteobacteria bacterium]|nr:substrate-binding domain-containing protein [Deltaproteobacteria bacterium]